MYMSETTFNRLYKTGILILLSLIFISLLFIAFKDESGRYIKYNGSDLILDTKTAKVYKYDILTMKLVPYHFQTVSP
jgi:hypothetical protein